MITTKWTGSYPNLCSGRWEIIINGKEVVCSKDNYDSILGQAMATYGSYDNWGFTGDWDVQWDSETDGAHFGQWKDLESTKKLLVLIEENGIPLDSFDLSDLYDALQENDWRSGSCGGCI